MRSALIACLLLCAPLLPAEVSDAEMQSVLEIWRKFEMPEPPKDATLALLESTSLSYANGAREPARHMVVWRLPELTSATEPAYLHGTWSGDQLYGWKEISIELLKEYAAADLSHGAGWIFSNYFAINQPFAMGVQSWARGDKEFGRSLVEASLKVPGGHPFGDFHQPECDDPRQLVAFVIWSHCANLLVQPESDRKKIFENMKGVYEAFPQLRPEGNEHGNAAFLSALEQTVKPLDVKHGSVEAEVAALHEVCSPGFYEYRIKQDTRYVDLLLRGFEAVPALINHLEDRRLTRSAWPGMMNSPPRIRTVGELAGEILQAIAAQDLPTSKHSGVVLDKAGAEAWWREAQKIGERPYLVDRLGRLDENPNPKTLQIIAHKYPEVLLDHYLKSLESGGKVDHKFSELLAKCSLNDGQKREAFRKGAASQDLEIRRDALRQLHPLDEDTCVAVLVKTLDAFGTEPTGDVWNCVEGGYTYIVVLTERKEAWDALLRAAKRAKPPLRMQYMNIFNFSFLGDQLRKQRLQFLAEFLEDKAVRKREGFGPAAGFLWDEIRVCDFVIMQIGSILETEPYPEPEWTSEQWSDYRAKVLTVLRDEGITVPKDE